MSWLNRIMTRWLNIVMRQWILIDEHVFMQNLMENWFEEFFSVNCKLNKPNKSHFDQLFQLINPENTLQRDQSSENYMNENSAVTKISELIVFCLHFQLRIINLNRCSITHWKAYVLSNNDLLWEQVHMRGRCEVFYDHDRQSFLLICSEQFASFHLNDENIWKNLQQNQSLHDHW